MSSSTGTVRQESWDQRFLDMAQLVATWSKDPSTKVGAVIVTPENILVSVGYNGFAQRMPDSKEHYEDRQIKYSRIVHAEANAILFVRGDVRGYTLYATLTPCDRCAVQIIQAGIVRVVASKATKEQETRWGAEFDKSRRYFAESGVTLLEV